MNKSIKKFIPRFEDQSQNISIIDINELIYKDSIKALKHAGAFTGHSVVLGNEHETSWLLKINDEVKPANTHIHDELDSTEAAASEYGRKIGLSDMISFSIDGKVVWSDDTESGCVAVKFFADDYLTAVDVHRLGEKMLKDNITKLVQNNKILKVSTFLYIIGDIDCNGNNILCNMNDIKFIDFGLSFADDNWTPVPHDVPYFMRLLGEEAWKAIPVDYEYQKDFKFWVTFLKEDDLIEVCHKYSVDYEGAIHRLHLIKDLITSNNVMADSWNLWHNTLGVSISDNIVKSEELDKGAMRRIAPVSLDDRVPHQQAQNKWQDEENSSGRNELAQMGMDKNNRTRALHKLSGKTATRRHPVTGEREFLLHRGMSPTEKKTKFSSKDGSKPTSHYSQPTSFTPKLDLADQFGGDYQEGERTQVVSAWIPESHISHIPKQYGSYEMKPDVFRNYHTPRALHGTLDNTHSYEEEVIINPHPLNIIHNTEVKNILGIGKKTLTPKPTNVDQAINMRTNTKVPLKETANALAINRPKKLAASEDLTKTPVPYEPQNEFKQGPVTDLVDIGSSNHKEVKLPNGLIYRTSKHHPDSSRTHHHLYHPDFKTPIAAAITDWNNVDHNDPDDMYPHLDSNHQIKASRVSRNFQGKGYGKSLYSAILEHHVPETHKLHSDQSISPEANLLWSSFKGMPGIGGHKAPYPKNPHNYTDDKNYAYTTHHLFLRDRNALDHSKMYKPIERKPSKNNQVKQDNSGLPLFDQKLAASESLTKAPIVDDANSSLSMGANWHPRQKPFHKTYKLKDDTIVHHHKDGDGSYFSVTGDDTKNGNPVAYMEVDHSGDEPQVKMVHVNPELRGQGYGKSLYDTAIHHYKTLSSDSMLSPASNGMWTESLANDPKYDVALGRIGSAESHTAQLKTKKSELDKGQNGDFKTGNYKFTTEKYARTHAKTGLPYHKLVIHAETPEGYHAGSYHFYDWNGSNGNHLVVDNALTEPEHRRLGLASEAYKIAETHFGKKIAPVLHEQTGDAQNLWSQPNRIFGKSEELIKAPIDYDTGETAQSWQEYPRSSKREELHRVMIHPGKHHDRVAMIKGLGQETQKKKIDGVWHLKLYRGVSEGEHPDDYKIEPKSFTSNKDVAQQFASKYGGDAVEQWIPANHISYSFNHAKLADGPEHVENAHEYEVIVGPKHSK